MNKNVSLAIEKAVGSISQKHQNDQRNNGPKKPDLFSLSGETELFQNERGITIKIDRSRDANLTDFGKATLKEDLVEKVEKLNLTKYILFPGFLNNDQLPDALSAFGTGWFRNCSRCDGTDFYGSYF